MERIDGIYVGKYIWASSYENGKFLDSIISLEMLEKCSCEYITSDIDSVEGKSRREIALAYYAYSIISRSRRKQTRVFEIICDGCSAELLVLEGFEQKETTVLLRQNEKMSGDETERFLASKYIVELFVDEYPDNSKLREAYNAIQDYELSTLSGVDNTDNSRTDEILKHIYAQIDLDKDTMNIELFGKRIVVGKEQYISNVSDEMVDVYVPIIQKLVGRISNNFEKDDIVSLYIKNLGDKEKITRHINKIAENNSVFINIDSYEGSLISRGNAYLYYLRNHVFLNRIKENIGRFSVGFDQGIVALELERGEIDFIDKNDFTDSYEFKICDDETKKTYTMNLLVPFSLSGTVIRFKYSYETEGLKIDIEDRTCGESLQEVFRYKI